MTWGGTGEETNYSTFLAQAQAGWVIMFQPADVPHFAIFHVKTRAYVFTINNPSISDDLEIELLKDKVDYLCYGREVGDLGTYHYQGYLKFHIRSPYFECLPCSAELTLKELKAMLNKTSTIVQKMGTSSVWYTTYVR